ncbi:MAG: phosphoenolpyruvate-utilizing N-terminal domain-containing protein, partial [Anaerotignaceae bacterium]
MVKFQGKSVYDGVAIGKIVLFSNETTIRRQKINSFEEEKKRVEDAIEVAKEQLGVLYEKALVEVGELSAAIFEVHQMMLEDDDYQASIFNMIENEQVNAEYSVGKTSDNFAEIFSAMDDEYMQARAADIKDISNRLLRILSGVQEIDYASMEPSIIVADDLSPSETVQMDKSKILAFVTVNGSTNSHTAILARTMNIPAIIGVPMNLEDIKPDSIGVVDGAIGEFIINPNEEELEKANKRIEEERNKKEILIRLKGKETVTKSGKKVNL